MLTVCPNCATSSGVEIATVQSLSGWMRQARCRYCQVTWQAELSSADKLLLVADALAPRPQAIAPPPQLAGNPPHAGLQFSGSSRSEERRVGEECRAAWVLAQYLQAVKVRVV